MSSKTHNSSNPGLAKYSSKSSNLGMGCGFSPVVRNVLRYSQSQSIILSGFPKHRLSVGSWDNTTTSSLERWMSVSSACVPASTALRMERRVFSGYLAL